MKNENNIITFCQIFQITHELQHYAVKKSKAIILYNSVLCTFFFLHKPFLQPIIDTPGGKLAYSGCEMNSKN